MIVVRPTGPEDLAALSRLFEARFGHALSPAEWTWKYRQLPGRAASLVAVEDASGEVLAHAGALRLPACWAGGQGGAWQLVDFAGAAGGRGLRPPLVEAGQALLAGLQGPGDAPFVFGFPSERHFRLGERVFGYQPLAELAVLAGPFPPAPPGAVAAGDRCDFAAEEIWSACGALGVRRTAEFLNWRYYARPERYYRFYRLTSRGVAGFAVFAFVASEAWAAELWLPPEGEWYPSLLAVAADLRAAGLAAWRFWPPPQSEQMDLLKRLGVAATGETRRLGCRAGASGVDPVEAAQGFTASLGDYDLV
jgi:hypothetical protein